MPTPSRQPIIPPPDRWRHEEPPRPSETWLNQPGWIDGGVEPPQFYASHEEILYVLSLYNPDHPCFHPQRQTRPTQQGDPAATAVQPPPPVNPLRTPQQHSNNNVVPPGQDYEHLAAAQPEPATPHQEPPVALPQPEQEGHGYPVAITMAWTTTEKVQSGRAIKNVTKKLSSTKREIIDLATIGRANFIIAFLTAHEQADNYGPGPLTGPPFKMWWTGCGGKNLATTIDNDRDFGMAVTAIGARNKKTCQVNVEFDIDSMEGFRKRKRPLVEDTDPNEELTQGTKVPRVEDFTDAAQLHGQIIRELQVKYKCEKHKGEHGNDGYCYVTPESNHIGLNARKLKSWAAAIAAHDATKHHPPNIAEFDGARDGRLSLHRPRGSRNSIHIMQSPSSSAPVDNTSTVLIASMLPLVVKALSNVAGGADAPAASSAAGAVTTTNAPSNPTTPQCPRINPTLTFSPLPDRGSELDACLNDLLKVKQIDLISKKDMLQELDFTPDIIPDITVNRLCEVLDIAEGRGLKVKNFVAGWNQRFEDKKHHFGDA